MAVITLAEYKALAGITGATNDTRISAIIPLVQGDIIAICNYAFGTDLDPVVESWPEGIKLYAAKMISYQMESLSGSQSKQSESIDGYSYTLAEITGGYPRSIEEGLKSKWGRVSAKTTSAFLHYRDRRGQTPCNIAGGDNALFT